MNHPIAWHTAQPLWNASLADAGALVGRFSEPALLRFVGDGFMKEFAGVLAENPARLLNFVARNESWRSEGAGWRTAVPADDPPVKLFQPVHNRYYLVTAALVCQQPGLPERRVDGAKRDRVSFVMRRLVPVPGASVDPANEATFQEYGWYGTQQSGSWQPVIPREQVAAGEERLAMFPNGFSFEGRRRKLYAGVIPVARQGVFETGTASLTRPVPAAEVVGEPFATPDAAVAIERCVVGLEQLAQPAGLKPPVSGGAAETRRRDAMKVAMAHTLLDLAQFLQGSLPVVWKAIEDQSNAGLLGANLTLYTHLNRLAPGSSRRYRQVLVAVAGDSNRQAIEDDPDLDPTLTDALFNRSPGAIDRPALRSIGLDLLSGDLLGERLVAALGDPRLVSYRSAVTKPLDDLAALTGVTDMEAQDRLLFALIGLADFLQRELTAVWDALKAGSDAGLTSADRAVFDALSGSAIAGTPWSVLLVDADARRLDILAGRITPAVRVVGDALSAAAITAAAAALVATLGDAVGSAVAARPLPSPAQAAAARTAPPPRDAIYVIRCVYERPACAGFELPVVSRPSAPFRLANFFDPDGPVRPIRIQMPEDVSLANFRKAPRGVAIQLSKRLRQEMDRARKAGLQDLMDGNVGEGGGFNFGVICSLSIPIITICALILLMIVVSLLNIIFWWLPYFILCLPRIEREQ